MTVAVITCANFSVLCLYSRVFVTEAFRRWTIIVGVSCLLWAVAAFITLLLRCIPISASWTVTSSGRCVNYPIFLAVIEAVNCFQDLVIVCLPIGIIWRLQLCWRSQRGVPSIRMRSLDSWYV